MSINQTRKPKGTPVGGQFDRTLGGGPATTLGDDTAESNLVIPTPQMTDEETANYKGRRIFVTPYQVNHELQYSYQRRQ